MNIALIGYGKMGKMIEMIAQRRGHRIPAIFDPKKNNILSVEALKGADIAIEFTSPQTAVQNYLMCFEAGIPVVSGTTGWLSEWEHVCQQVGKYNTAFFYASNFSLGVNILFQLNDYLARKMADFPEYEKNIIEIHHNQKIDAPSGTAITLAEKILDYNSELETWVLNTYGKDTDLSIFSIRERNVPGTHSVNYISDIDKISIKHEAFGREGFALGAVRAAEFVRIKKGVYSMEELLAE